MAFRSLAKSIPVNVAYRPSLRITPVMTLRKSYSAAANKPTNEAISKDNTQKGVLTESTTTAATTTTETEKSVEKVEEVKEVKEVKIPDEQGYAFGAYHWNMERAAALTLIPLISTQFVYGTHPVVDGLIGVILPYHVYMGFDSCITDYIQKRNFPRLYKAANWANFGTMGLVMWGCYEFNTNDVGITEFIQRLWTC